MTSGISFFSSLPQLGSMGHHSSGLVDISLRGVCTLVYTAVQKEKADKKVYFRSFLSAFESPNTFRRRMMLMMSNVMSKKSRCPKLGGYAIAKFEFEWSRKVENLFLIF